MTTIFAGQKSITMNPYFYTGKQFAAAPHIYCGSIKPNDFYSYTNKVHVRFRSNEGIGNSGFQLEASILKGIDPRRTHLNYS